MAGQFMKGSFSGPHVPFQRKRLGTVKAVRTEICPELQNVSAEVVVVSLDPFRPSQYVVTLSANNREWRVLRSYSEFREFRKRLKYICERVVSQGLIPPLVVGARKSFPRKRAFSTKTQRVTRKRSAQLSDYLNGVIQAIRVQPSIVWLSETAALEFVTLFENFLSISPYKHLCPVTVIHHPPSKADMVLKKAVVFPS